MENEQDICFGRKLSTQGEACDSLAWMIRVRPATRDDGEVFLGLVQQLADFEHLDGPDPEARARLLDDAFADPPRFELFLAELDGAPVAYAACFSAYSTFRARPTLFLEDLFVAPTARRRGVARAVLAHLHELARERGCGRFEWMVLDWNENARALYESAGAVRQGQWMLYRIDVPDAPA